MSKVINRFEDTSPGKNIKLIFDSFKAQKPIYDSANDDGKKFLLTVFDDCLFCGTGIKFFHSGLISEDALQSNLKPTNQHRYPRKLSTKFLLENLPDKIEDFTELYIKFCMYDHTTSEENNRLKPFQKEGVFKTPEHAYEQCGIKLVKVCDPLYDVKHTSVINFFNNTKGCNPLELMILNTNK